MQLKALRHHIQANWQQYAVYGGLFLVGLGLLAFRLGTLLPGYSVQEIAVLQHDGVKHVLQYPVNAPYYALVRVLSVLRPDYLLWGRVASVLCGALTLVLFCGLVWHWHGRRNALLGTALFGTSAWFLHAARWGTPDVALFFVVALIACYLWLHNRPTGVAVLTAFALTAVALYIPGMVWFIAVGAALRWRSVDRAFRKNLWAVTAGGLLLLAALAPLALAIYHQPAIAKTLAGLPAAGWPHPVTVAREIVLVPYYLFVHGPVDAERWLGDVPVVDVFTAAMFLLGAYLYIRHFRLKRVQVSLAIIIGGAVLVSLGGAVSLSILIPFVYIIATAGIGFMLDRWLEVFPRNSLAQWAGYGLVGLAIISAASYSLGHYFIAWPQAQATRARYSQHRLQ